MRRMIPVLALTAATVASVATFGAAGKTPPPPRMEEIPALTQRLLDAIASGDKTVWDRAMAEDAIYAGEDGSVVAKQEFLPELHALPPGYSGTIKVENSKLLGFSGGAIHTYDAAEEETIFGQVWHTRYHVTDTWVARENRWQLLATQVVVLAHDPVAIELASGLLDAYAGTYELAPGVTYAVRRDGDHLIGQRSGRPQEELKAEFESVFFHPGSRIRKVFVKDASGRIAALLDRRDGNDLRWKRLP